MLLASAMQKKGYQCVELDADITGPSIPYMFGIHQKAESDESDIFPQMTKDGLNIMSINLLESIVENMSYFECSTSHDKHDIFSQSNIVQLAEQYQIKATVQISIVPELAADIR